MMDMELVSDDREPFLCEKAMESPYLKKAYTDARKAFIAYIKVYNTKNGASVPPWVYELEPTEKLRKLREKWTHFQSIWPTIGYDVEPGDEDDENKDLLGIASALSKYGRYFREELKNCESWVTYSKAMKILHGEIFEYCNTNIFFKRRRNGELRVPWEPPRDLWPNNPTAYFEWIKRGGPPPSDEST